jgi:hypothetical protein
VPAFTRTPGPKTRRPDQSNSGGLRALDFAALTETLETDNWIGTMSRLAELALDVPDDSDAPHMSEFPQFEILKRIAVFSARLRGHELTTWCMESNSATAVCSKCGRAITVYASMWQPEMDGAVLDELCHQPAFK